MGATAEEIANAAAIDGQIVAPAIYGIPVTKYNDMFAGRVIIYYIDGKKEIVKLQSNPYKTHSQGDYTEVPRA